MQAVITTTTTSSERHALMGLCAVSLARTPAPSLRGSFSLSVYLDISTAVLCASTDDAAAFSPLFTSESTGSLPPDLDCASPFLDKISTLDMATRTFIITSIVRHYLSSSSSIRLQYYDARVRSLVRLFSNALGISWASITVFEDDIFNNNLKLVAQTINTETTTTQTDATTPRTSKNTIARALAVGSAATLGAIALGLTGGLAAPALIAGASFFATVTASALGAGAAAGAASAVATTAIASTTGAAIAFGGFGAAGAVTAGRAMMNRTAGASSRLVCLSSAEEEFTQIALTQARARVSPPPKVGDSDKNDDDDDEEEEDAGKKGFAVTIVSAGLCFGSNVFWFFSPFGGIENADARIAAAVLLSDNSSPPQAASAVATSTTSTSEWAPKRTSAGWWRRRIGGGRLLALVFDPKELSSLSEMLDKQVRAALQSAALSQALKLTALNILLAAWTLPSYVLSALTMVDNPWSVAIVRAVDAGHVLANDILNGSYGQRPVSLIGYGLGAVVCYTAALDIAKVAKAATTATATATTTTTTTTAAGDSTEEVCLAATVLLDVILMGAAVGTNLDEWTSIRNVTSGRVINCFTSNDLVLFYMYRLREGRLACAGLSVIGNDGEASTSAAAAASVWGGIESFDVSDLVAGHLYYPAAIEAIAERIGLQSLLLTSLTCF